MSSLLRAISCVLLTIVGLPTYAQLSGTRPRDVDTRPQTGTGLPTPTVERQILFGGTAMTEPRAERLASAAGFQLLDWHACDDVERIDNCVMLVVRNDAGEEYAYVVSADSCVELTVDPSANVQSPRANPRDAAQPVRRAGNRETARTATGRPEVDSWPYTEVRAHCFGSRLALLRARQTKGLLIDHDNLFFYAQNVWEIPQHRPTVRIDPDDDGWSVRATEKLMAFEQWLPPSEVGLSGMTSRGHAYELIDGAGRTLGSDGETVNSIAGSGDTRTKEEMCKAQQERLQTRTAPIKGSLVDVLCIVTPLPDEISIGEGLVATKYIPYCSFFRNAASELTGLYEQSVYDDCMANPGRYDPENFPPEESPYSLAGFVGAEPLFPVAITLEGAACPMNKTESTSWEGAGMRCETEAIYVCGEQAGQCKCEQERVESVCIEPGPPE
jgi:hypothetical protein